MNLIKEEISDEIKVLEAEFNQNFSKRNCILYDRIFRDIFEREEGSGEEKQAEAFTRFLKIKEICLTEHDIFAGQIQHYLMRFSKPFPEDGDPACFDPSVIRTGAVNSPMNACATVNMCLKYDLTEDEKRDLSYLPDGVAAGYFTHYPVGHAITGFPFILHTGFSKIKELIKKSMSEHGGQDERAQRTGNVMIKTIEACRQYFLRYEEAAERLYTETKDHKAKKRMRKIADALKHLCDFPAENFFEALQFTVLLQELILTETKGSMSFGRLDVLFFEYLKEEDKEEAQKLIDAWMLKAAGCIGGFQNLTLGGCDRNGIYCGNKVSLMFLRAARRLKRDQPLLSFRITDDLPREHFEEIIDTLKAGGGFPALFNDNIMIKSKLICKASIEEARDYGIVGCVEPGICGREFSNTEAMRINWCKTLELMLNKGVCPVTGKKLFLKEKRELDKIESFEEFLAWFKSELAFTIEKTAHILNIVDRHFYENYPSTLLTITLSGGIEALKDCGAEGCFYRNSAINHTGMASAADSLLMIKKTVFEEHRLTLTEWRDLLDKDFSGQEELRKEVGRDARKFGNGSEEADTLMAELVNESAVKTQSLINERGGIFMAGFYSVYHHAAMGLLTGALPNGKKKGEALSNGLSPVQGADRSSPTAVICAMEGFHQELFGNGMVLDLKFSPHFFNQEAHRMLLWPFVKVYFEQGGMELQLNVVDKKLLLDARQNPEKYGNLIVRVSGFSAYFVNLFEELQDEIIKRTEYAE